jgi:hypothetical protein
MFGPTIWVFNVLFVLLVAFRVMKYFRQRSYDAVMRAVRNPKPATA